VPFWPAGNHFRSPISVNIAGGLSKFGDELADEIEKRLAENDVIGTVAAIKRKQVEGDQRYDLICGQGRLEAYQSLGQREIPAIVVSASDEDSAIMSLVENCCACRKSNPNILVVRPAQDRAAKNGPGQFDGARDRRILLQR
jgi:hypothetical protein